MPVSKKEPLGMPDFIQALYGVVVGVGSLKVVGSFGHIRYVGWWKAQGCTKDCVTLPAFIFTIFFVAFTILIVAHDWFTYHQLEKPIERPDKQGKGEDFWRYSLQIGSLFFLAQMLNAAADNQMLFWYGGGFIYTIFNWVGHNARIDEEKRKKLKFKADYFIHFVICIVGGTVCFLVRNKPYEGWVYTSLLVLTISLVIWIWERRRKRMKDEDITGAETTHDTKAFEVGGEKDTENLTYGGLLTIIHRLKRNDLRSKRMFLVVLFFAALLSFSIIAVLCWQDPQKLEALREAFGITSILAGCATAVYILIQEDEISARNIRMMRKLNNQIKDSDAVKKDFIKKVAETEFEKLLNETAKKPLNG